MIQPKRIFQLLAAFVVLTVGSCGYLERVHPKYYIKEGEDRWAGRTVYVVMRDVRCDVDLAKSQNFYTMERARKYLSHVGNRRFVWDEKINDYQVADINAIPGVNVGAASDKEDLR